MSWIFPYKPSSYWCTPISGNLQVAFLHEAGVVHQHPSVELPCVAKSTHRLWNIGLTHELMFQNAVVNQFKFALQNSVDGEMKGCLSKLGAPCLRLGRVCFWQPTLGCDQTSRFKNPSLPRKININGPQNGIPTIFDHSPSKKNKIT